jgi:cysteine desulfurase
LPNTLLVAFPQVNGRELLARAAEVGASTGSACHSGAEIMSPTLKAMGVSDTVAAGTVRLSLGWPTSQDEVEFAAQRLISAWETLTR